MTGILTVTLNPSLDVSGETETIRATRKCRTENERYDPGGGGINVARVIRTLGGEAVFTTGSGDLVVGETASGRVTARTASGDVRIGVRAGTPVWTDVRTASGRLSSSLPSTGEPAEGQPFLEVRATTASGDVTLHQG